jgi:profilin
MSWDSYRDSLIETGSVDKAAFCGAEDGSIWTQSPGFNISQAEVKSIISGLRNPEPLRQSGVHVGGTKYMYLQSDDTQIQAKKGSAGLAIAKSNKCVILGLYRDGQQPGNCRLQVERIRDYLLTSGY